MITTISSSQQKLEVTSMKPKVRMIPPQPLKKVKLPSITIIHDNNRDDIIQKETQFIPEGVSDWR